jgi:hypothetical protein
VTSSGNRLSKKAKKDAFKNDDNSVDGLVQAIDRVTQTLATLADAIKKAAIMKTAKKALLDDLFEEVDNLPDFKLDHKSKYYAHLVANPNIGGQVQVLRSLGCKSQHCNHVHEFGIALQDNMGHNFVNERC